MGGTPHPSQALGVSQCSVEHERQRVGRCSEQMLAWDERRDPPGMLGDDHGPGVDRIQHAQPFEVRLVALMDVEDNLGACQQVPLGVGYERRRAAGVWPRVVREEQVGVVGRQHTRAAAQVLRPPPGEGAEKQYVDVAVSLRIKAIAY